MKDCGIYSIDTERKVLEKNIRSILSEFKYSNSEGLRNKAIKAKEDLSNFRMRLAYDRSTEALESNFGWTSEFSAMTHKLDEIISFDDQEP